ncbi:hypothetical protein NUW58_g3640 [Xylaria curta]|uniref:Uncharacterized protein n=1 Tax=Xylaria curta TaxID=42375 RepID=A0ACC1PBJ2_9PEZI|nr:hypothetical protein NUW58_g3640 [Xylaria curta]
MGDIAPSTNSGGDDAPGLSRQGTIPGDEQPTNLQGNSPPNAAAFQGQYQQMYAPPSNLFAGQLEMPASSRQGPYDMNAMVNALPQAGYRQPYGSVQQYQRYTPNMVPQMPQYPGHPHVSQLANQQYYLPHQPIPQLFNSHMPSTAQQHQQHPIGPQRGNIYYPNSGILNQSQASVSGYFYSPPNHFPAHNLSIPSHAAPLPYYVPDGSSGEFKGPPLIQRDSNLGVSRGFVTSANLIENRPNNTVRGPPRKPRQSGHAIWIGNLPPQTDLMSLVHHVCKETAGLESLFLISKSNCAFANFKNETSCVTAQQKLHDSKFQSVRLVSRLRKSTVEGTSGQTAPTGPAATVSPSVQSISSDLTPLASPSNALSPKEDGAEAKNDIITDGARRTDKFFILKSLTVEDLELSIRNGVWATQSHNEETLNGAFVASDNVYLIFSANKSGEYFGYARMISAINNDPAAAIEFAPKAQTTNDADLPKAIPTEATETCPRGRIIDDSARGTIFWEVDPEEIDGASDIASEDSESAKSIHDGDGGSNAWGKPFQLEWLSTTRLPFYKTRGLRNPWNSNREVKIARDGTELEPTIGRKLIGLFNRAQSPVPLGTIGIVPGYPPHALPLF